MNNEKQEVVKFIVASTVKFVAVVGVSFVAGRFVGKSIQKNALALTAK